MGTTGGRGNPGENPDSARGKDGRWLQGGAWFSLANPALLIVIITWGRLAQFARFLAFDSAGNEHILRLSCREESFRQFIFSSSKHQICYSIGILKNLNPLFFCATVVTTVMLNLYRIMPLRDKTHWKLL